jgi:uncharacterized protein with PIN domain
MPRSTRTRSRTLPILKCPVSPRWNSIVIGTRKREPGLAALDRFLEASRIRVIAFDAEQLRLAWWDFGKGRHPAALNLGDCCSYGLARASRKMLLFIRGRIAVRRSFPQFLRSRRAGRGIS